MSPGKQREVIAKVEDLERQIADSKKVLENSETLKMGILKKYL